MTEQTEDKAENKAWEEKLLREREYSDKIVDTVREGLLVLKPDLMVEFANKSFYDMFRVNPKETEGNLIYNLGNGQWDIAELRTLLEDILPQEKVFNGYRVAHAFEEVGYRVMLLNARRLDHVQRILLAIEDITDRERYEEELQALNAELEERVVRRTAQVEKLARELTMAEHEERGRIAQILHDDLQQQLYALQVQMSFIRDRSTDAVILSELDEMGVALEKAIRTARQLSVDLSPPILEGEGLTEAIRWLAMLMQERHRLRVTVEADNSFTIPDLDRRVLIFQAVRELLFNVIKHAHTLEALVRLEVIDKLDHERMYRIDVIDDGVGFNADAVFNSEATPRGRGLLYIQQRVMLIRGRLEVKTTPGQGSQMTILVPPQGETAADLPPE